MSRYSSSQRGPVNYANGPYSTAPAQHYLRHSQQVSSADVVSRGSGYVYSVPVIYGPMSPDAYHDQHEQFAAQLPHGAHGHHSSEPSSFNEPNGTKSQSLANGPMLSHQPPQWTFISDFDQHVHGVKPQDFSNHPAAYYQTSEKPSDTSFNPYGHAVWASMCPPNDMMMPDHGAWFGTYPQQQHWSQDSTSNISSRMPSLSYVSDMMWSTMSSNGGPRYGQHTHKTEKSPCGPPTKPKQSGFALWVGNLPPGVAIVDVKDFFSRSATHDIESVRLISKSNCAFVNYRTEAACQAAAQRFDDARMLGFRLSCRTRNAASRSNQQKKLRKYTEAPSSTACDSPTIDVTAVTEAFSKQSLAHLPARYFILKSLTEQDVAASIRSGQWSTQIHNEGPLNDAHKSAENVFLIFSVNKSGEYAGYARMSSQAAEQVAVSDTVSTRSGPGATRPHICSCPGTEWAPSGRIVVDKGRGTTFWEALPLLTDPKGTSNGNIGTISGNSSTTDRASGGSPDSGASTEGASRSFQVDWVSTQRLPFFKVRGLRNSWNANRLVKIAGDGTEIELGVGAQLINIFGHMAQ